MRKNLIKYFLKHMIFDLLYGLVTIWIIYKAITEV